MHKYFAFIQNINHGSFSFLTQITWNINQVMYIDVNVGFYLKCSKVNSFDIF